LRNTVPFTTLGLVEDGITPTRRLAAIMLADVAGYSRLMERDEHGTHLRLRELRTEVIEPAIGRHYGRLVRSKGDDLLVEFASAVEALSAAVEIQQTLAQRNRDLAPESRIELRIGINLGDILVDDGEIAGDGVNVAARLESLAEPGEVAISAAVREQVRQLVNVQLADAGQHRVKNISRPIRVYKVRVQGGQLATPARLRAWIAARPWRVALVLLAPLLALLVVAAPARWAGEAPARRSVAILPMTSNTNDAAAAALARQLTADSTAILGQMLGGTVAAPGAAAAARTPGGDLTEVGRRLNVRYLLEGEVERGESDIRLQARLLEAATGRQIWSARLTAPPAEPGRSPPDLIGPFVNKVSSEIRRAELARPGRGGADPVELQLRAWTLLPSATTEADVREVKALFERALAQAPENVDAIAGLVYVLDHEANRASAAEQSQQLLHAADQMSLKAISIGANSALAWRARATVLLSMEQLEAAAEAVDRALAINAFDSEAHALRANILLLSGRAEEAVAALDRAIRLNPDNETVGVHLHTRCRALLYLGRHAEAIASCKRGMAFAPDWPDYMLLAAAYAQLGDQKNAAQARDELLRREPQFTIAWLRAKSTQPHPVAAAQREAQLIAGLRKAGVAEQ
jgi:class 3 adenylate cyclase/TolB-like protein/tetratricopeptide (TPR) repeat protein